MTARFLSQFPTPAKLSTAANKVLASMMQLYSQYEVITEANTSCQRGNDEAELVRVLTLPWLLMNKLHSLIFIWFRPKPKPEKEKCHVFAVKHKSAFKAITRTKRSVTENVLTLVKKSSF